MRQYRAHVDHHILPLIGAVKLARLSTPIVQAFREKLLETRSRGPSRARSSPRSRASSARRCGAGSSHRTPLSVDVKKHEQGELTIGVDVPSKEEVSLLLDRAQGRWRPFFVTAVLTGMRASELRGLLPAGIRR